MLVLSRKLGEVVTIDGAIRVEVVGVSGNRVRLGITAPHDCRIFRAERRGKKSRPDTPEAAKSLAGSGI